MVFRPIVGTLGYLWDRDADRVLLVRRDARPDDDHFGKVNGLGGKLEPGEDVVAGMRRELHEEAGLEVTSLALRGTITWTNFGPRDEDWLGFVFLADAWRGEPPERNEEGGLIWVARTQLLAACDSARSTATRAAVAGSQLIRVRATGGSSEVGGREAAEVVRAELDDAGGPGQADGRPGQLDLWDGDRHFLPLVFDDDPRLFHGAMPYDGDQAVDWTYTRL